jgi:hypothetical protein
VASTARQRDQLGLAESLELAAILTPDRHEALGRAVQNWAEVGYSVTEAKARLVAATLAGDRAAATLAEQSLRSHGVHTDRPQADLVPGAAAPNHGTGRPLPR